MPEYASTMLHPHAVTRIRLELRDDDGKPMPKRPYLLRVTGADEISAETNEEGMVDHMLKVEATEAELVLPASEKWPFEASYHLVLTPMPPVTQLRGAQARLNALGYHVGYSNEHDEATTAALVAFQLEEGLEANGELNAATAAELDAVWQRL